MKPATPDSPITSPDSLYSLTGPTVTNRKKVQGKARPTIRLVRSFDFKLPTVPLVCGYNAEAQRRPWNGDEGAMERASDGRRPRTAAPCYKLLNVLVVRPFFAECVPHLLRDRK